MLALRARFQLASRLAAARRTLPRSLHAHALRTHSAVVQETPPAPLSDHFDPTQPLHASVDVSPLEEARIKALLFALSRRLTHNLPADAALAQFLSAADTLPTPVGRAVAHEGAVHVLLGYGAADSALRLYDAMCADGYTPTVRLRAFAVALRPGTKPQMLQALSEIFADTLYTTDALRELLEVVGQLAPHSAPSEARIRAEFVKAKSEDTRDSALEDARIRTLLRGLERALAHDVPQALTHFIDAVRALPSFTTQHTAFENGAYLLLVNVLYTSALHLHAAMTADGHTPSLQLRAILTALEVVQSGAPEDTMLELLQPILAQAAYNEEALRHLLRFLGRLNPPPSNTLVDRVVEAFANARTEKAVRRRRREYTLEKATLATLVRVHSKLGTYATPERLAALLDSAGAGRDFPLAAWHALLASSPFDAPAHVQGLLERMAAGAVAPDVRVMNALLVRAAHTGDAPGALAMFAEMCAEGIVPDANTFRAVFAALGKNERARVAKEEGGRRSVRTRRDKYLPQEPSAFAPASMPSRLRTLYRMMLATHTQHTLGRPAAASSALSPPALLAALHAFLAARDYAGAYVVLRTHFIARVELEPQAWRVVFRELADRLVRDVTAPDRQLLHLDMQRERIGDDDVGLWTDRFLDSARHEGASARGQTLRQLVYAQLMLLAQTPVLRRHIDPVDVVRPGMPFPARLDVDGTAFIELERSGAAETEDPDPKLHTPSLGTLLGISPFPANLSWERAPLERLLKRAILASMPPPKSEHRADLRAAADARAVSATIRAAKDEMLPALGRDMGHMYRHRELDRRPSETRIGILEKVQKDHVQWAEMV